MPYSYKQNSDGEFEVYNPDAELLGFAKTEDEAKAEVDRLNYKGAEDTNED